MSVEARRIVHSSSRRRLAALEEGMDVWEAEDGSLRERRTMEPDLEEKVWGGTGNQNGAGGRSEIRRKWSMARLPRWLALGGTIIFLVLGAFCVMIFSGPASPVPTTRPLSGGGLRGLNEADTATPGLPGDVSPTVLADAYDFYERHVRDRVLELEDFLETGQWREPQKFEDGEEDHWDLSYVAVVQGTDVRRRPRAFATMMNRASALIDAMRESIDAYEAVVNKLLEGKVQPQARQEEHVPQQRSAAVEEDSEWQAPSTDPPPEVSNTTQNHIETPTPSPHPPHPPHPSPQMVNPRGCQPIATCTDTKTYLLVATDGAGDFDKPPAGETIWMANVAHMLLGPTESNCVHVLSPLRHPKQMTLSLEMIGSHDRITILDTHRIQTNQCVLGEIANTTGLLRQPSKLRTRITPPTFSLLVTALTLRFNYSMIIFRNRVFSAYAWEVIQQRHLLGRRTVVFGLRREGDLSHESIVETGAFDGVLSPAQFSEGRFDPERDGHLHHYVWLPPMVKECLPPREKPRTQRICYIGSYSISGADYMLVDMLQGFSLARRVLPGVRMTAVFTKLHRATTEFQALLNATEGLDLLPPVTHEEALDMLRNHCDMGVRGLRGDERDIMSTKVLEMGSTALPIILNPLPIHRLFLGNQYPLFWTYEKPVQSFADAVVRGLTDETAYATASHLLHDMAQRFLMGRVYDSFVRATNTAAATTATAAATATVP